MADDFSALVAAQKETSRLLQEQIRQNMTADERAESDRIAEEKRQKASEAATRGWQTRSENAAAKAEESGGAAATSGAFSSTLTVAPNLATSGTVATGDIILFADINDSNNLKKTTVADINALGGGGGTSIGLVLALG